MISIPLAPTQAQGLSATPDAANAAADVQSSGAFQAIFAAVSAARPGVADMMAMAPTAAIPAAGEFLGINGLVISAPAGQPAPTLGTTVVSPAAGLAFPADATASVPAAVVQQGTALPGLTAASDPATAGVQDFASAPSEAIAAYGRTGTKPVADAASSQGAPHAGRRNEAATTGPGLASATPATIPTQPGDILAAPVAETPVVIPGAGDTPSGEAGARDVAGIWPQQEAASSPTQSAPVWLPVQGALPGQTLPAAAVAPTQAAGPGTPAEGFRPMADGLQPPAQPSLSGRSLPLAATPIATEAAASPGSAVAATAPAAVASAPRPSAPGSHATPSAGSDAAAHATAAGSALDAPATSSAPTRPSTPPGSPATAADAGRPADRVAAPLAQPGFETPWNAKIPGGNTDTQTAATKPAAAGSAMASTVPASQPGPAVNAGEPLATDGIQPGARLSAAASTVDSAHATHISGIVSPTMSVPATASTSAPPVGPGTGAVPAPFGPATQMPSDAIRSGGPAMAAPEQAIASAIPATAQAAPAQAAPADMAAQWGSASLTTAIQPALAQNMAAGAPRGMAPRAAAGAGFAAQLADQAASAEPLAGTAAARTPQTNGVAAVPETAPVATDFAAAGEQARADTALPIAQTASHRSEAPTDIADARQARQAAHAATTQVAVAVVRAVADGVERISIKLQPPELGRIDVRLDVGADGRVQAYVLAERPATLEILQRDSRELERALNGAGLDTANGGLSFGLRQNGNGQAGGDGPAGQERRQGPENRPADAPPTPLPQPSRAAASGRLDIQV
jgi:flagellar hook-length control protein FliK